MSMGHAGVQHVTNSNASSDCLCGPVRCPARLSLGAAADDETEGPGLPRAKKHKPTSTLQRIAASVQAQKVSSPRPVW